MVTPDALWYQSAVIYQVHVRAFCDSNGDGIGDFRGLVQRLDYLQQLGVNAVWLLPFYPSPLKDDGYDIADYRDVHPQYGTLDDFRAFLREAHQRGLRVITELVLNHTSDQHPWFQRARRAAPGSRERDFYVWSDSSDRYREARVIFQDFETSNWSWDPVARAYYWHRFFHHQPDLNYDHPPVRQAILEVVDHWLDMGVDGLRLDGVPYLFEREGTTCENLPETHAYLKQLRAYVDQKYHARMFLAEANQWPEDAAAYFGAGDECHTAFHFPLMPRMYMSLQMEDRFPIIDILDQTPEIPANCQWMLFLRNHDELTLEMVTEQERDYMYRVYARDPQARLNLGIRRRLAPLMQNDRRKIELLNGLLLSLPGTPIIYYGDEIGMGDNIYLGDRNGVRTPMQWRADRNAGFSPANPQRLYLPPIIDYEYHYETINVETQRDNPNSLLAWMKCVIHLRRQFEALMHGQLEFLHPDNPKVLAFTRSCGNEHVLVVANLSCFSQYVELDLRRWEGSIPVELFGQTEFPRIGELPYLLTITPYAFLWFVLPSPKPTLTANDEGGRERLGTERKVAGLQVHHHWARIFHDTGRQQLERLLPEYLRGRHWFKGRYRRIRAATIADVIDMEPNGDSTGISLALVDVYYTDDAPEKYLVPLTFAPEGQTSWMDTPASRRVLARLEVEQDGFHETGLLLDAFGAETLSRALIQIITQQKQAFSAHGTLQGRAAAALERTLEPVPAPTTINPLLEAFSHSSLTYDERYFLKMFRRLEEGLNPEWAMGNCLMASAFPHSPPTLGLLEYRAGTDPPITLGILEGFVEHEQTAWQHTLNVLDEYRGDLCETPAPDSTAGEGAGARLVDRAQMRAPDEAERRFGGYLQWITLLGRRAAELHVALAHNSECPEFVPESYTVFHQRSMYQSVRNVYGRAFRGLRRHMKDLPERTRTLAEQVIGERDAILDRLALVLRHPMSAARIRCHGDFRLEEVLYTGEDFVFIDFEGERDRPISERQIKTSPLRDVAGMIHSLRRAADHVLDEYVAARQVSDEELARLDQWMEFWHNWTAAAFLRAYQGVIAERAILPNSADDVQLILDLYALQKYGMELQRYLEERREWVHRPLAEMLRLLRRANPLQPD